MRRQSNSSTSKGDDGSEESPKRKRRSCAVVATQRIQTAFNLNNANKERRSMSRESDELPNCVLQLNDRCLKNAAGGQLITKKEYVCGLCCTALWQKSSNYGYYEWKRKYEQESRCRVTIKAFIQDQILDYWVKCVECSKWRAAPSEDTFRLNDITTFLCDDCTEPQDEVFESIRDDMRWHNSLSVLPYLQNNPVKLYLKKDYFLEEIGLSPTENSGEVEFKLNGYRRDTSAFLKPFHAPQEAAIAFCMRPDCMEYDEKVDFKSFAHEPRPYLAVRNLVIALWNIAPFRFLTLEDCARHLICRGHSRIYLITQLLPKVHWYLMRKGLINYGVINVPLRLRFVSPQLVVVIGGGISGICVTRQLNCMGINARLYEGKSDLGGRMRDETTLGVPVGRGAQLVVGIVNNPITLMCEQIGASYRCTNKNCPMIDADRGLTIKKEDDNIVDVHFNKMLDLLFKWKKTHKRRDASLEDMMNEAHKQVLAEETTAWKPLHERCLQFHFGNVEFSCGAKLSEVSWREWDQNEAMPMFAGAHALLVDGTAPIIDNMSEEIPYQIDRVVTKVYWPDNLKEKVRIDFADGDGCEADKVVIAMPLSVLQKSPDLFEPALPLEKREALTKIGAGLIEKVAVRFKKPFWSSFLKDYELDYFSHVPAKKENRNLFNVFYDFSSKNEPNKNDCKYVLMSYVCAESVHLVQSMTDAEVVKVFIETLNDMFPATGKEDLEPLASMVTHWGSDPFIGMSYSYVRVGGTGAAYDVLAKELNRKLYFVGEHTSRFYPQTMTGAYISAQREAGKIAEHIAQEENQYDLSLDDEQP